MWIDTGKKLVNIEKYAQIAIEATPWDTYQLVASNDDIEEEVTILGEYITRDTAEDELDTIAVLLRAAANEYRMAQNWIIEETISYGYDCPSM